MRQRLSFLSAVFFFFCLSLTAAASEGSAFFDATLTHLDETPAALNAYRGKPLLVNFWARWCGPCRTEIPELNKISQKYKKQGLIVIGIALEDKAEAVLDFSKAYEIDYNVIIAKNKGIPLMQALGNDKSGVPFTIVMNPKGEIVYRKLGGFNPAELEAAINSVLF